MYSLDENILQEAVNSLPQISFKLSLNHPTEDFFYSPWVIKDEYKGTVWNDVLKSLPEMQGEARLIKLDPGFCYYAHADIDDRWHLSLQAEHSFLVDIQNEKLHKVQVDGKWYYFEATNIHSATNFSNKPRIQLVVRKLLQKNKIIDPICVNLILKEYRHDYRYLFDSTVSPWLNKANKTGYISNFEKKDKSVKFIISEYALSSLKQILPKEFELRCL